MIARFHARAIGETAGAELVACTSHSPVSAEKFAAEFHCDVSANPESLLARDDIDAITICTPSGAHLDSALAAARAGKHLMIEKPLEITPERCDQIILAASENGIQVATVFQSRFSPVWQRLKNAVERNDFGILSIGDAAVMWFRPQSYYDSAQWRGTWRLDGGGALMNQAIHTVDLLLWMMGPVVEVSAFAATRAHERIEVEDTIVATLRFANGALGTITATTTSHPGQDKRIEIHGSEGSAIIEEDHVLHWSDNRKSGNGSAVSAEETGRGGSGASDPAGISHRLHAAQYADFIAAIQEKRAPFVDGNQGRISVELIDTIYRSAKERRVIRLD